jgi:FkbM family methyltransferase
MNPVLKFTRCREIPLNLRRTVAKAIIPRTHATFELEVDGVTYRGRMDNYVEWLAFVTGSFFEFSYLNLLRRLLSGGTALDVGANVGNHSLAFSQFFDLVHSVEPFPLVAGRLAEKAAYAKNIVVHTIALSDATGEARFAPPVTDNLGTGRISDEGGISVQIMRGDEFVAANVQTKINFVKIDVEGHEAAVLRGLRETIARDRPAVRFEVAPALRRDGGRGLCDCFKLFPDDYSFVCMKGQSTFPTQRQVAAVWPLDKESPTVAGKMTYVLAFGPERGFVLEGRELRLRERV